jgi:predicted AlkP superfamily pyrophosphatase or phosphodiesterase
MITGSVSLRAVRAAVIALTLGSLLGLAPAAAPQGGRGPAAPVAGPAVLLVSIDGFRADYLDRFPTPNLHRLAASGVRARWLVPAFPSITFPNHYTIVTGLYPAHHGIVANAFLDPTDSARFRYSDPRSSTASRWWGGEPLWVTAVKQGRRAASFFWPGSEAEIGGVRPTIFKPYDDHFPNAARVDTVLSWLALPDSLRPAFITLYFSIVDHYGHGNGPDSPQLAAAVDTVDGVIGRLLDGLQRQGIASMVNVIVVSDHGMAGTSDERRVVLDDYVDRNAVDATSLGPFIALRARGIGADSIVRGLSRAPHLHVYLRDQTPERWHYRDNPRIGDVTGVADAGWVLTSRAALATGRSELPGNHGFDNADSTMRAFFIASGPGFRRGAVVEPFQNIHVYDLVCRLLGLTPAPNDGSLDSVRAMLR